MDGAEDGSAVLSTDVVFDVLKNRRRRLVMEFVRDGRTRTLSDVAEHVAAVENGKDVDRLTSRERKRVYVGLYQCHVPMLAEAGVVDYDEERKTIELLEASSQLYPYLDLDPHAESEDGSGRSRLPEWLPSLRAVLDRW